MTEHYILPIEDHNEAYHIWHKFGLKDRVLVHIDSHIDFAWFVNDSPLRLLETKNLKELNNLAKSIKVWNPSPDTRDIEPNIGNYICQSIRDGLIREFYWVVPPDFLDTPKKSRYWKKRLRHIVREMPKSQRPGVFVRQGKLITKFLHCEFLMCSLSDLPHIPEKVILDIDTDFFITDFASEKSTVLLQTKRRLPWIWPEELAEILRKKGIKADLVTIAYSVEKYFTPLEFKFLGDDLKVLLQESTLSTTQKEAMEYRKKAMLNKYKGLTEEAIKCLKEADLREPQKASHYFNLALIQFDSGYLKEAYQSYQKAISLDASYRTRYNNLGELYNRLGLDEKMEQEYKKLLILDPQNPYAHSGIGELLLIKGKFVQARERLKEALFLDAKNQRAKYLLSEIMIRENKLDEAISLLEGIITEESGYLVAYLLLAGLYARKGLLEQAITHYKRALRLGFCDTSVYVQIGYLYLRKGFFLKALSSFEKAIKIFPRQVILNIKIRFERIALLKKISANMNV